MIRINYYYFHCANITQNVISMHVDANSFIAKKKKELRNKSKSLTPLADFSSNKQKNK